MRNQFFLIGNLAFKNIAGMVLVVVFGFILDSKFVFAQASPAAVNALEATAIQNNHSDVEAAPGVKPPLPFRSPLVGPLIKQGFPDDIDRRTTAFIPQSLEQLTPIEFPKGEKKWIRVDLSEQMVVAYEDDRAVRAFVISSGLPGTTTVTGQFRIRAKVLEQTMYGGVGRNYYYLPGVKWVQYFHEEYSFHGTYWHNNFGTPMSHGCLNMTNTDAKWLFDWADPVWDGKTVWYKSSAENPGTVVIVHE